MAASGPLGLGGEFEAPDEITLDDEAVAAAQAHRRHPGRWHVHAVFHKNIIVLVFPGQEVGVGCRDAPPAAVEGL